MMSEHKGKLQLVMQSAAWVNFPSRVLENATGLGEVGTIKYLNKVSTSSEVRMFVSTTLTANSPTFITGKRKAFIISVSAEDSSLIGPSFRVQPPPPPTNRPKGIIVTRSITESRYGFHVMAFKSSQNIHLRKKGIKDTS